MGDTSGGKPSSSGLTDMKELLQKTRTEYQTFHPKSKQWPCPFCIIKSNTLIQCRIHIFKDHAGLSWIIPRTDKHGFFPELKTKMSKLSLTNLTDSNLVSNTTDTSNNNLRPKLIRKC